jgi:Imm-5 like putative immunity protein
VIKIKEMKKFNKQDQRSLAIWAADCAERVLPFFEKVNTKDNRPRKAIEACRIWVRTDVFKMADIRGASLAAHAAAREAKENPAACFAARAAGQAVATAHIPQHAFGAAYYALKAIAAANPAGAEAKTAKERNWQSRRLPNSLRQEVLSRIVIEKRENGIFVKVRKDKDF